MSIFKRTFASVFYKVDQVVGEIENHDALIQAAIREQKRKLVAAKVELKRLTSHGEKIWNQIIELEKNKTLWEERAANEEDDEKALACIARREAVTDEIARLNTMLVQYSASSEKMKREIKRSEAEVTELTQKHQIMRARQSTADALGKLDTINHLDTIDTSFDRWEVKISQGEYAFDEDYLDATLDDELESVYIKEENEAHLREQLAIVRKRAKANNDEGANND